MNLTCRFCPSLLLLALCGCVDLGRPIITEASPELDDRPRNANEVPVVRDVVTPPASRVPIEAATDETPHTSPRSQPEPPPVVAIPRQSAPHQTAKVPAARYQVQAGDTLYSIAWRFGFEVAALARANKLAPPYTIYPGQTVTLRAASPTQNPPEPRPVTPPRRWQWPVKAEIVKDYGSSNKGIDYRVTNNQAVGSAAEGRVVYAGNGIGGYARLIIVRHGGQLLSAYSFNGQIGVKEQQNVKAGDKLADIKNIGRASQILHFELRKRGVAINPHSIIAQ